METTEGKVTETPISDSTSTKLRRIAELAREDPERSFLSLAHNIDLEFLREAYRRVRKDGAPGVDGQGAEEFARDLEGSLQDLLDRFKSKTYRAPPVRRVHIPKGGGKQRPLGIPTFADKVLQMAASMVLTAVYEADFLDVSYGFRPGRSPRQAAGVLREGLMELGGGWVLDVDIRGFFDNLDHAKLQEILAQRVSDGVLRRTIGKWLKAGVLEEGEIHRSQRGTPQGGVISPLLANVYLHEVLDTWYVRDVKPRLRGASFLIRYADDFVLVFEREEDARRVLEVLPKRLAKYGLSLNEEKTRLLRFKRPTSRGPGKGTDSEGETPGTFDFLGFTYHWARSRKGFWVVKRKTASRRLTRGLKAVDQWCRIHRHRPIAEQQEGLSQKLRGHYAYYGVTANYRSLKVFYVQVERCWKRWLARRGQKRPLSWERFRQLRARYPLPLPRIRPQSVT